MAADWDKIKAEYIAGGISFRELAEKHGISQDSLRKRAAREKWTGDRKKASTKTAQNVTKKIVQERTKAAVSELDVARYTTMLWQDTLKDIAVLVNQNKETYAGDLTQLNAMSNAIKSNIDNLYRVSRMLTASEERKLQLEERRIALEEKRFEAEQKEKHDTDAGGIVVTMKLPEGVDFG